MGRALQSDIDRQRSLFVCLNALHRAQSGAAKMVKHPKDYPRSSYHYKATGKPDSLIAPHELYLSLSKEEWRRRSTYAALYKERLSLLELENIRAAINKAWALGLREIQAKSGKAFRQAYKPTTGQAGEKC